MVVVLIKIVFHHIDKREKERERFCLFTVFIYFIVLFLRIIALTIDLRIDTRPCYSFTVSHL